MAAVHAGWVNYVHGTKCLLDTQQKTQYSVTSKSRAGQLGRLGRNISKKLNSVVRVLWRPSKLCTWFIFHSHSLLLLDTSSSSYLTLALLDLKCTILQNCLRDNEVRWRDGLFLSPVNQIYGDLAAGMKETESRSVCIATIMGQINAFLVPATWTSGSLILLWYFYELV